MEWVVRERYDGRWVSTYFSDSKNSTYAVQKDFKSWRRCNLFEGGVLT